MVTREHQLTLILSCFSQQQLDDTADKVADTNSFRIKIFTQRRCSSTAPNWFSGETNRQTDSIFEIWILFKKRNLKVHLPFPQSSRFTVPKSRQSHGQRNLPKNQRNPALPVFQTGLRGAQNKRARPELHFKAALCPTTHSPLRSHRLLSRLTCQTRSR